jgi:hypothetical protein
MRPPNAASPASNSPAATAPQVVPPSDPTRVEWPFPELSADQPRPASGDRNGMLFEPDAWDDPEIPDGPPPIT